MVDALAAVLLAAGIALFAMGRQALGSLADGTYPPPMGETWVARADFHTAQTRWGMWCVVAGVVVGAAGAARHALHRRTAAR